ncbi:hypothetical protein J1614_005738 [Plenodomus biglobosus]|nr:hypothetical protein J1614_005738 [Plenodomus biglobosus]
MECTRISHTAALDALQLAELTSTATFLSFHFADCLIESHATLHKVIVHTLRHTSHPQSCGFVSRSCCLPKTCVTNSIANHGAMLEPYPRGPLRSNPAVAQKISACVQRPAHPAGEVYLSDPNHPDPIASGFG